MPARLGQIHDAIFRRACRGKTISMESKANPGIMTVVVMITESQRIRVRSARSYVENISGKTEPACPLHNFPA